MMLSFINREPRLRTYKPGFFGTENSDRERVRDGLIAGLSSANSNKQQIQLLESARKELSQTSSKRLLDAIKGEIALIEKHPYKTHLKNALESAKSSNYTQKIFNNTLSSFPRHKPFLQLLDGIQAVYLRNRSDLSEFGKLLHQTASALLQEAVNRESIGSALFALAEAMLKHLDKRPEFIPLYLRCMELGCRKKQGIEIHFRHYLETAFHSSNDVISQRKANAKSIKGYEITDTLLEAIRDIEKSDYPNLHEIKERLYPSRTNSFVSQGNPVTPRARSR